MAQRDTISIGLLWHSANSGNLGVGALTVANMALARRAADEAGLLPRFLVIGSRDQGPDYVQGPDVDVLRLDTRTIISPSGYWSAIKPLDVILDIGGGDSFADIYGNKRFAFLWLTKMMAIARRKPLLLSPQTIGPFTRQPHRWLATMAMRGAAGVVARDPMSADAARIMLPGGRVSEAVDVAFALPFEQHAGFGGGVTHVGINVSGLLFNGGYGGGNDYGLEADYPLLMRKLLAALHDREDIQVHLVTHATAPHIPNDDDARVADLLAGEFPRAIRVPDFASPSAAKSYISGLDMLIAARMHACIAAYSSGVPVVPIAYSRKFTGLFEGVLGYHHVLPVKGLDTDAALAFLLDRLGRRDALKADVAYGNRRVAALLDRYVAKLKTLFADAR